MRFATRVIGVLFVALGLSGGAFAQSAVTPADVQRLQDGIADVSRDVADARGRDAALATKLQAELDDLRDETTYLRVKLRKNEPVARGEYSTLRDKIDDIRFRARGDSGGRDLPATSSTTASSTNGARRADFDVPVSTEIDVRLQRAVSSSSAQVEDRFEAATAVDLLQGDRVLIPAGSVVRGVVRAVNKAGRVDRKGSLDLAFDQITVRGRAYPMRATVTKAIESEGIKGETEKIGVGAGIGAILGGILGGFKGVLAGIAIGGGGVIAATEGSDVNLASGTVLRIRLDTGLDLRDR